MLQLVNVGHKSLADYATIATRGLMDEIRRLAEPLSGKRVAHVSATAFGGGVAEINYTLIPLMQDAGREVEDRYQRLNADEFDGADYDFVVMHDPQPLGIVNHREGSSGHWIWRCHI